MKTVPEMLTDLGNLYRERNALYKDNYKNFGFVMEGLFPKGVELHSPAEFNRFALLVQIIAKISRYAFMFKEGGHSDSLDDNAVYSQMLQEVDAEIRLALREEEYGKETETSDTDTARNTSCGDRGSSNIPSVSFDSE